MRQPCGSACSARIWPPCSSTIQRAIERPEPAAAVGGRARPVGAVEALEDALGLVRRDARALVGDLEPRVAVAGVGAQQHARPRRRMADRVRDEVREHLVHPVLVRVEDEADLDRGLELHLALLRRRAPLADDVVEELLGRELRARRAGRRPPRASRDPAAAPPGGPAARPARAASPDRPARPRPRRSRASPAARRSACAARARRSRSGGAASRRPRPARRPSC